jgi:AraC-like DNA-binding protein
MSPWLSAFNPYVIVYGYPIDILSTLLDGPRARGAFLLRSVLQPPWSLRIQDEAPLTLVAMVRGDAWMTTDDGETGHLNEGDIAIVRGIVPYVVSDLPTTEPQVVIHPGQRCTTPSGFDLNDAMGMGIRSWGNQRVEDALATVMLTGTYQFDDEISQRLLNALPASLVVRADETDQRLVSLLADEMAKDQPGQQALLDRLLDLLLISTLRVGLDRPNSPAPAWYRAYGDPIVGSVLRLIEQHPEHPWTVASLAAEANCSRALLSKQFTALLSEPPMHYLTEWRLSLAADLLRDPTMTLAAIAQRVGYSTPFALSSAFKRSRGLSPQEHRAVT